MDIKGLKGEQTQLQKDLARGYVDEKYMKGVITKDVVRKMNPQDSEEDISRMMSLIHGRAQANNILDDMNNK